MLLGHYEPVAPVSEVWGSSLSGVCCVCVVCACVCF